MADIFIILAHVQFEKNGYQNRYKTSNGWVTKPVNSGVELIKDKFYTDGNNLLEHNLDWIRLMATTLGINTEIVLDYPIQTAKTERLIELIGHYKGTTYITNPDAKYKYLDEKLMQENGINIEYCNVPKHLQIHTFEAFDKWGIEGTAKQLPKKESLCVM